MTSTAATETAASLVAVGHAIESLAKDSDARRKAGSLISTMRKGHGWKPAELADRAGLSRAWMYEIEAGRSVASPAAYRRIAEQLGVPLSSLLDVNQGS